MQLTALVLALALALALASVLVVLAALVYLAGAVELLHEQQPCVLVCPRHLGHRYERYRGPHGIWQAWRAPDKQRQLAAAPHEGVEHELGELSGTILLATLVQSQYDALLRADGFLQG